MRYVALQRLQIFAGRSRRGAGGEPADETAQKEEMKGEKEMKKFELTENFKMHLGGNYSRSERSSASKM